MSDHLLHTALGEVLYASAAWHAVEPNFSIVLDGNRAGSIAIVGSAGSWRREFVELVQREAHRRNVLSLTLRLQPGESVGESMGQPIRTFLAAQYARRPGLPTLVSALAEADEFVEMWTPVVWPLSGDLPKRLIEELVADSRELSRQFVASIETTRVPVMVVLDDVHQCGARGRAALRSFSERRGTSASFVIAATLPETDLGSSFTELSMDALGIDDVGAHLGPLAPEVAQLVLTVCDGRRWILHQLELDQRVVDGPKLGALTTPEAKVELRDFWSRLCRANFLPLAEQLDPTDRRILTALAKAGDAPLDLAQVVRTVGDTDRFNSGSSFLHDHITSLVERGFLGRDADDRLYPVKPGLSTFLRRT
jgi:hypothetical protein